MRLHILLVIIAFVFCENTYAQDLGRLPDRLSGFWKLRLNGNKADALGFVEPGSRNFFLQQNETGILSFKISSIEVAEDSMRADVVVKIHVDIPKYGEFDRTVRESWVWMDGNWYWKTIATPPGNPFATSDSQSRTQDAPVVREFRITDSIIDLGRHVQGDVIEGRISFRASANDVRLILVDDQIQGLSMNSPVWTSRTEGYVLFRWDTAAIWESTRKEASLEAVFVDDRRQKSSVPVTVQIDGRVSFKQTPEIIDPAESRKIELEIGNLLKAPLKIVSAMSSNPAFAIDEPVPQTIPPGSVGRLSISHAPQTAVPDGSIEFKFSEPVIGSSPSVTVPLRVKLPPPPPPPAAFSREDAERLLRSVPRNPK